MNLAADIENPIFIILMAILLIYAVFRGKHNKIIAYTAFGSMLFWAAIAFTTTKETLFSHSFFSFSYMMAFLVFMIGGVAWIILDIQYLRSNKENGHKA